MIPGVDFGLRSHASSSTAYASGRLEVLTGFSPDQSSSDTIVSASRTRVSLPYRLALTNVQIVDVACLVADNRAAVSVASGPSRPSTRASLHDEPSRGIRLIARSSRACEPSFRRETMVVGNARNLAPAVMAVLLIDPRWQRIDYVERRVHRSRRSCVARAWHDSSMDRARHRHTVSKSDWSPSSLGGLRSRFRETEASRCQCSRVTSSCRQTSATGERPDVRKLRRRRHRRTSVRLALPTSADRRDTTAHGFGSYSARFAAA